MILELGKRGTHVLEAKGRENLLDRLLYNAKKKKTEEKASDRCITNIHCIWPLENHCAMIGKWMLNREQ